MLKPKQEKFIQNITKGMSQREAYKNSYDTSGMKDETIDSKACILFHNDKVRARYNELIKMAQDEAIMCARDRMKWLTDVVKGEIKEEDCYYVEHKRYEVYKEANISTKIKALDTLNKMDGQYVEKIESNINVNNPYEKLTEEELRKLAGDG